MIEIYDGFLPNKNLSSLVKIKSFTFNGGEPFISIPTRISALASVIARIQSGNDLIELCNAVDALKRNGSIVIDLYIPYWPGARQDRVCNEGEALTTKVYADIINSLECASVQICDPHSDVTPALINRCKLYPIEDIIKQVIDDCKPDFIVSPDAGATKRIYTYLSKINCKIPVIQCLKKRDTITGKLSGFQVCNWAEWSQPEPAKLLIIDDICDGGGTFVGLADEFKDLHLKNELYLYTTHGIFSQGYTQLLEKFEKLYTTDSFQPKIPYVDGYDRVMIYRLY